MERGEPSVPSAAAEAAVILAWRTLEAQGRVGLAVATGSETRFLGWAASARAFAPLLDQLAAAHRDALEARDGAEPALAGALATIDSIGGGASMTLASALDAVGDDFDAVAGRVARRRDLDILLIADRFQIAPPRGVYAYRTREGDAGRLRIAGGPSDAHDTCAEGAADRTGRPRPRDRRGSGSGRNGQRIGALRWVIRRALSRGCGPCIRRRPTERRDCSSWRCSEASARRR